MSPVLAELRAEARRTIASYCQAPLFREAMLSALARPGFLLHPTAPCRAGIFTLEIYRAISGSSPSAAAIRAAVAVEIHMQSAYMFDNIADCDLDPGCDLSPAEELALAIGLLSCGQATVCEAAYAAGLCGTRLQSLLRLTSDCASACCAGQFLDAHLERRPRTTTDEALKMTSSKAGSFGRFAASLGASMATDDEELLRTCGDLGFNLFTYFQLLDDLRDACLPEGQQSDLMRHKKTLPVVFFQNSLAERCADGLSSIMPLDGVFRNSRELIQAFKASEAQCFCAIVAEAFLNRARSNLSAIKKRAATVGNLERFICSFEINPKEVVACL